MNVYSIDIQICATAYIKAETEEEAMKIAQGLKDQSPSILDHYADVEISGRQFDDPELPDVSLSPAMMIHGIWPGSTLDLAEELSEETEDAET